MAGGMNVNRTELGRELMRLYNQVSRQIEVLERDAAGQNISPHKLQDLNGTYQMTPLLAAKAQLLHSLVLINQKDS
jgi:molybdenum-dependent DNA-binding transcriptional regulator ModE